MLFLAFALQAVTHHAQSKAVPTQAMLDGMSDGCRTPRQWLRHASGKEVLFQSGPGASFEDIICVLRKVYESDVPMELGFVGNAQVSEKK